MSWLVFAPTAVPGEDGADALAVSHWMALQTVARGASSVLPLLGPDATRSALAKALPSAVGVAFYTHGSADGSLASSGRGAAVDTENAHALKGRWVHAVACHGGGLLRAVMRDAGVACFAGYDTRLIVDWNPSGISPALAPLVGDLVSSTPCALADGDRDVASLKRRVNAIADAIADRLEADPWEGSTGLEAMAQQLVDRLIVDIPKPSA